MPKIIDERVVEMKFDNKQFEHNAQNSLKTLDNLKKSLNFNGAVKGLQQFEKASNGINLSGMESAIQTVQNRFSTLGVMGDQIIRRLTDSALNMARRMGEEFTIKPMRTGFQEYETQINAVQTIMANTGAPIEKVNAALDELNAYADKTIYNFTEMTRNIGTFTAAGVDMDTSVEAIKGISNLAAISGSSSQQASTAMYQLSQALASGTVKLMDWNSVVNAGMGGQVFQDALKDTARLHGIAIDQMIEEQGSFRETLQYGWISSEILTETLAKFTGDLSEEQLRSMGYTEEQARKIYEMGVTANDAATKVKTFTQLFDTLAEARQSGWTQSWEIIIGDFEEAKGLLTTISERFNEAIGDSANARNLVLQQWSDLGGRTLLIESVINVLDTLEGIVWSVKNAFYDIFPEVTAENLFNITSKIWELTDSLKNLFSFEKGEHGKIIDTSVGEMLDKDKFAVLGPVLENISKVFKGFFSIIDAGLHIIANFGKIVLGIFKMAAPLGLFLLNLLGSIGDYFSALGSTIKNGINLLDGLSFFEGFFESVNAALFSLLFVFMDTTEGFGQVVPNFKTLFAMILDSAKQFASGIYSTIIENDYLGKAIDFLKTAVLSVLMVVPAAIGVLASLLSNIKQYISENKLLERVTNKVRTAISNFVNQIKSGYSAIKSFVSGVVDFIKEYDLLSKIAAKVISFFKSVAYEIKDFWTKLVEAFRISSKIDTSNISGFFAKLKARLEPFKGLFPLIEEPIEGFKKLVTAIKTTFEAIKTAFDNGVSAIKGYIGTSAGILSSAYKALGEKLSPIIDWIANNVDLGTVFKTITLASALINVAKFAKTLTGLGTVLKGAVENFGKNLSLFVENTKKIPEKEGFGNALLKIAGSIGILVASLWVLSKIDQNRLNDGMLRLGALAVGIIAFFGVMKMLKIDKSKAILTLGDNLIKMAGAIIILIAAISLLSGMSTESMATGLIRIGEILLVLTGISKISGGGLSSSNGKPAFVGMAVAVMLLAWTLKDLAKVKPEVMAKGLIAMGLVLLELAVFTRIANGSNLSSGGKKSPAFISMAISVMLLADVLKGLGRMDPDRLKQGLIALGAILLEIGVFSRLMSGSKFDFKNTVLMLVALGGSLFLFMEAINKTANVSGAKMLAFGVSFGVAISALALSLKVLSKIPILQGIQGMGNLAVFAAGLTGIIAVLGLITQQLPELQSWLSSGGETLGGVGTAIGNFIHGIINPNGEPKESTFSFERLGTELGNFVTNAEPFFNKMKDLKENELTNIGQLAGALTELGAASAMTKGKSMSSVGTSLNDLGVGLENFSSHAKNVDTDAVEGTKAGLEMLTDICNKLPETFGVIQAITGRKDLVDFAFGIKQLGFGIKSYSDNAVKVNTDAVEGTKDGLQILANIYNQLTPINGVVQLVTGQTNMFDFAFGIKALGLALKSYSDQAVDIDTDAVEGTKSGLEMLKNIYNNLTPIGGVVSFIDGEVNPFDFAFGIKAMGWGLKSYSDSIVDVDAKAVKASADALSALAGIYNILPNLKGAIGLIEGDPDIAIMGEQLPILGSGLSEFYTSLGDMTDFSNVSSAATALKDLAGVYEYIPKLGGVVNKLFTGEQNLGTFGTQMSTLGQNMSTFVGYFTGEEYPKMTEGMKNASGIFDSLRQLFTDGSGNISVPDYSQAITNFTDLLDLVIIALEPYTVSFYGVGSNLMVNLTDGVNSVSDYPITTFTTTLNSCIRSLNSYTDDFYIIGQNYGIGIANGIMSQAASAINAANRIANAAISASKKGFNEHSPSKEGYQIGAFFTEGIANGMLRVADLTNRAADQISSEAIHSAQEAISMINSIVESGDVAPTITPVLDLSNVASGAGRINGLLGQTKTLTAEAINIRSLNHRAMSLQSGINQNGTIGRTDNRDVVEAIRSLGSRIDTLNEDIRNLKLVLNTGVLAGELEPEINRRLGLRMSYEERGI